MIITIAACGAVLVTVAVLVVSWFRQPSGADHAAIEAGRS
jgi:hypothetical protein